MTQLAGLGESDMHHHTSMWCALGLHQLWLGIIQCRFCCCSRKIPGYPKIDTHNDYFLARFDGALIDGQSWGTARPSLGSNSQTLQPTSHSTQSAMLARLHQKEVCGIRCPENVTEASCVINEDEWSCMFA